MRRWVCELGGAELLLHGVGGYDAGSSRELLINAMQQWYIQFGARGHPPVHGDEDLAHAVQRWEQAAKLGAIWWGNPRHWKVTWPQAWVDQMAAEAQMRADTKAAGLFITANQLTTAGPRARRRRR